jgi:hypothetical protein
VVYQNALGSGAIECHVGGLSCFTIDAWHIVTSGCLEAGRIAHRDDSRLGREDTLVHSLARQRYFTVASHIVEAQLRPAC